MHSSLPPDHPTLPAKYIRPPRSCSTHVIYLKYTPHLPRNPNRHHFRYITPLSGYYLSKYELHLPHDPTSSPTITPTFCQSYPHFHQPLFSHDYPSIFHHTSSSSCFPV